MMLGLRFSLTPAQTKMLVVIYAERWSALVRPDPPAQWDYLVPHWPQEGMAGFHFITTMKSLQNKGLVSHDNSRIPSFQLTEEGEALAKLVLREAKTLVDMMDGREERFVRAAKMAQKESEHDKRPVAARYLTVTAGGE